MVAKGTEQPEVFNGVSSSARSAKNVVVLNIAHRFAVRAAVAVPPVHDLAVVGVDGFNEAIQGHL